MAVDGQDAHSAGALRLAHSTGDEDDQLAEARALAGELDLNHAPEPGALREIGVCRRCGMIVARDKQGRWSHQPSVGELEAGKAWMERNPVDHGTGSEPSGSGVDSP